MDDQPEQPIPQQQQNQQNYYETRKLSTSRQPPPQPASATAQNYYGGNVFLPQSNVSPTSFGSSGSPSGGDGMNDDERPLLEELGINFDHIRIKTLAVLNPLRNADISVINDNDLAGPLVFCLLFGASLLLHGKVQFGYIYGIGVLGCLGMYALLNLMSTNGITITCTVSVLGYCLLPMALLSLMSAVLSFKGIVGLVLAGAAVLWCSFSASKLFVIALTMDSQRFLVAYPCSLLYGVFALLAIF